MNIDYKDIYDKLYEVGYHDKGKNHGERYCHWIVKNFRTKLTNVLEIGCSNGLATKVFHRNHIQAYGIDVSRIAIRYACDVNGIINCIEGSALNIPFRDKFFNGVFSCDVLEHLHPKDVEIAMNEMFRVCSKFFFIKVSGEIEHNREFMNKARSIFGETFPKIDNLHLTVMKIRQWIQLFEKRGCDLIKEHKGMLVFEKVR